MKVNIKHAVLLMSVPISQAVRGLLIVFLMAKYLSISDVGVWGQVLAAHGFIYMFVNLNLTHSMSRFFPSISSDKWCVSSFFWGISLIIFFNVLCFSLVALFFSESLTKFLFDSNEYGFVLNYLLVFIFLENAYNLIYCFFRSVQKFVEQAQITFLRTFFELSIVGGGLVYFGISGSITLALVFILYSTSLLLTIAIGILLAIKFEYLLLCKPSFSFLNKYLKFGLPQLPASLSYWLVNLSDRLFIVYFLGIKALGIYFIANRIGMLLSFPLTPMSTILQTECSKLYDKGEFYNKVSLTVKYMALVGFMAVVLFFSVQLLENLVSFEGKSLVLPLLPYLFVSLFLLNFISINNVFDSVELNSLKIASVWSVLGGLNLIFNFTLIPLFGVVGAIYASIISYIVGIVIQYSWRR